MTNAESLKRYRTIAFGLETMAFLITLDVTGSSIEAGAWWAIVPDIYKPAARTAIETCFDHFVRKPFPEELIEEFIADLNSEIVRRIAPR